MIKIGGHIIDAATSEEESLEAEVTEYPVESGGTITDHTRNLPRTLEIEFVVSDTPIGQVAASREAGVVPSSDVRQKLEALRDTRQPFQVVTSVRAYDSMVFVSLSFPRDGATGDALRGRASLKQIQIVDVRRLVVTIHKRAARRIPGKKIWLCPVGVATSTSDSENLRHKCREVITKGVGFQSYLAFADTGEVLTAAERARVEGRASTLAPAPGWDEISEIWESQPTGTAVTKQPTLASVVGGWTGVPEDYEPPDPPYRPQGVTPTSDPADYYRNPFQGQGR